MNKKSLLLILTTTSFAAVVATTLFVSNNFGTNAFALNREVPASEYSITMSGANCTRVTSNLLRSSTDSGSWSFDFFKNGDSNVAYGSFPFYGGGDAFLSFQGNDSYSYLNNNSGHGIFGITSITVNYCRQTNYVDYPSVTSAGEDGDLKILYGYIDSEGFLQYETTAHDLSVNSPYDMSDLQPRYFKITGSKDYKTEYTNGRINIESIKICYSCHKTRSDGAVREKIFSNLFDAEPVKNGNVWTYGYYPQSLSGLSDIFELDFDSDTWEPLDNGYYLLQGEFYARVQAEGTGYNNEYIVGDYYWFKVEPITWRYIDGKYDQATFKKYCNVVVSEKVLDTSVFDAENADPTSYTTSTELHETMMDFCSKTFPASSSSKLFIGDLNGAPENNVPYGGAKTFPLTYSTLYDQNSNYGFHYADGRIALATDYARCRTYNNTYAQQTDGYSMSYWTRSVANSTNHQFHFVNASGGFNSDVYNNYLGIRPAAKIIESTR